MQDLTPIAVSGHAPRGHVRMRECKI